MPPVPSEDATQEKTPPTAHMLSAAKGLNAFTVGLYNELAKTGNTIVSPFSVGSALSLLELGAKGESSKSLHSLLGASSAEAHRDGLSSLLVRLRGGGEPVEKFGGYMISPHKLTIANSLWAAKNYAINPDFIKDASRYYEANASSIDVTKPALVANQVNAWVEQATSGKITDLIRTASVSELTRLILVSAVHFIGRWKEPFSESETSQRPFYVNGSPKSKDVATMARSHFFRSAENNDVTIVELPYWSASENSEMAMTILLPKQRDGLNSIEESLTAKRLQGWLSELEQTTFVHVKLPKWHAESSFGLSEPLQALGVNSIFSSDADFGGISKEQGLQVSDVLHKTYINVDEKGTEAAAATAIMMMGAGMPPKPLDFNVAHPFLYLIRDTNTGTILFIGRVVAPTT